MDRFERILCVVLVAIIVWGLGWFWGGMDLFETKMVQKERAAYLLQEYTGYTVQPEELQLTQCAQGRADMVVMVQDWRRDRDDMEEYMAQLCAADSCWTAANVPQAEAVAFVRRQVGYDYAPFEAAYDIDGGAFDWTFVWRVERDDLFVALVDRETQKIALYVQLDY